MKEKIGFLMKVLGKCLRHPGFILRALHPRRIKKFFVTLRSEGMEGVVRRFKYVESDYDHRGETFDASKYDIIPVRSDGKSGRKEDYECFDIAGIPKSGSVEGTGCDFEYDTEVAQEINGHTDMETYGEKAPVQDLGGKAPEQAFESTLAPLVSIVIPVYNQFDYTYKCIKQIKRHSGSVSYEIIVADDCSSDLTQNIEDIISGLKVIHNDKNLRFLRNCNNAAKKARGEYILFLNNDTQVQDNWLEPLVDLMSKEKVGMTGSKLVYASGALQEAGGIIWKDGSASNYGNGRNPDAPEFNFAKEVDYISGASIMIRRSLWEEIGGFDERFAPAYYEDTDLAFEVRKRGYKVIYQPKSVVVHFEGISNGTDLSTGQKAYQMVNQKKFYDKWKDILESRCFPSGRA